MPALAQQRGNVAVSDPGAPKKRTRQSNKEPKTVWRPSDRDEKGRLKTKIVGKDIGDFDPKKNLPLKRGDFENPADYFELTADRLESKVASLREQAKEERALGSVKDRVKARKFKNLHAKFASLEKELRESGMSNEAIAALLAG